VQTGALRGSSEWAMTNCVWTRFAFSSRESLLRAAPCPEQEFSHQVRAICSRVSARTWCVIVLNISRSRSVRLIAMSSFRELLRRSSISTTIRFTLAIYSGRV
jgi:hypothetical protein